ncbi:activating signal cointegrator 1-like [Chenopodium quinoa]|uniref:Zinc finger C2HC5-type domain-containing protein n=1 Tax=Chenopodium quinoa TaxID=63459 RepID=A0A803L956_CHEQI|nr:activating signal cointegrator 1-like [Chenopodium quinoa]XP_021733825.1 activating signal cointegrator 1-like [Chenopodium quinoa]
MESPGQWLEKELNELCKKVDTPFDFDSDMISGLVSYCEFAPPLDAKEYLDNIVGEEAGKTVIQEYLRRRGYSPSPEAVGASASKLQAYVKPSADEGLTSGAKKPSRAQKEASASNNQNSKVKIEAAESGNRQQNNSRKKKGGKVISLAEAAKGTIVYQQGKPCSCQARRHRLVSNCLSCGKIVCEQEGEGPCNFCGALVLKEGSTYAGLEVSAVPETEAEVAANAYAKRLVDFDRNAAARTSVIDDQSDYYDEGNSWLSMEEKELLRKKQEEIKADEEAKRKRVVVAFDLVGRRVLLNQDDTSELETGLNILRPPDQREASRVKPNPTLQVQPVFIDPGPREKPLKDKRSNKGLNKGLCLEISGRVQHDRSDFKHFVEEPLGSSSANDYLQGLTWNGVTHMEDDAECSAY